ncbi:MAG: insulinase family protein [Oscillospiraceae bacterium]|nr:insulinase family protein [Oscillospiraceae bacterium]
MTTNIEIAPNITLRALQSHKFKTACFSVSFVRPHCRQTAALDALLPSVLLRGTARYPDISRISGRLDELYGASFGTLVRRKGEVKLTGFYADFIEDEFLPEGERIFDPMVDFLGEVLYAPYVEKGCFSSRFVEGEKQNLINAIESSLNDKRSYATLELLKEMCAGEDYGVPRLGYAEDVEKITAASLWEHYQKLLKESPMEIFYAGRRSPQEAADSFARLFGGRICEKKQELPKTRVIRQAGEPRQITKSLDVTQGKLVMGLRTGITVEEEDYPALLLLNAVFGAGVTSKLFVNVREKLSVCYYASSNLEKYKGIMLISSGIAFENYEKAKAAILGELEACRQGRISQEELEAARRMVLSALRASQDAPVQLDDFYCGMAIGGGKDLPEIMSCIEKLQVEELTAAARKLSLDTIFFLKGEEA